MRDGNMLPIGISNGYSKPGDLPMRDGNLLITAGSGIGKSTPATFL